MVRIGLHLAEVTRDGADYRGQGVHAAARVTGLAGGEEICVSAAALEAIGDSPIPISDPQTVELKGIKEPVTVYRVDWR
jgi:class 3 adenylate cyclase